MSIEKTAIVIYDGICPFCIYWIKKLKRFDRKNIITVMPMQSLGASLTGMQHDAPSMTGTVVLLFNGHTYIRSEAVLKVLSLMGFPFSLFSFARIIPRFVRDKIYDLIASNRYILMRQAQPCSTGCESNENCS